MVAKIERSQKSAVEWLRSLRSGPVEVRVGSVAHAALCLVVLACILAMGTSLMGLCGPSEPILFGMGVIVNVGGLSLLIFTLVQCIRKGFSAAFPPLPFFPNATIHIESIGLIK